MKKIQYLTIISVIAFAILFTAGSLIGSQSERTSNNFVIDNGNPVHPVQVAPNTGDGFNQEDKVFSKTTIIFLVCIVLVIVAFRRNTYN